VYSTPVYFHIPRQTVVLFFGNSTRRYQKVYAKNLTLHKGIDNKIQFQFLNQEQKPVDITNKTLSCRILSHDGTKELIRIALTPILPLTGIAELQLREGDLMDIDAQPGAYSIEIPDGEFDVPVFVSADAGARGVIRIVDSIKPKHVASEIITVNSHREAVHYAPVSYTSGSYLTSNAPLHTFQLYLAEFAGNIQVQGTALDTDVDWYNIDDPLVIADPVTKSQCLSVDGFHRHIRLSINDSTSGNITKILVR